MDYEILDSKLKRIDKSLSEYRGRFIDQIAKILYENLLRVRSDTQHSNDVDMFEINQRADFLAEQYSPLFFKN